MPEWLNGPHSKCGVLATVPGVRIPLSPPPKFNPLQLNFSQQKYRTMFWIIFLEIDALSLIENTTHMLKRFGNGGRSCIHN